MHLSVRGAYFSKEPKYRGGQNLHQQCGDGPFRYGGGSKQAESAPGHTKAGDSYLRRLLVQGAHFVLRSRAPDTALRRWGLRLRERGGARAKKRAIVAVARKLAILLHKLRVTGAPYRPFPAL